MTNKIKAFCLIIGLIVCLLIVIITKAEAHEDATTSNKINRPVITQSVVNTGTQWIIQTTYKFLKTN